MTRSATKSRSQSRSLSPYESRSKLSSKREKRSKRKSKSNDSERDGSRSDSKVRSKKRKHKDHDRRSREQSESCSRSRSQSRGRDRNKSRNRRRSRSGSQSVSKKRKGRSRSHNDDRERDRDRDKSKSHKKLHGDTRDRDRDQDRHRDRSKRSGSRSRKYSDEMCDSYQNNSNYEGGYGHGLNRSDQPSRTLMLSSIPLSITQKDIYDEIISCKINPRDIRLIKRKESNESRGFAFIDFESIEDATEFMDMKNGVLMLGEHSKSYLQYSVSKMTSAAAAAADQRTAKMLSSDWFCITCNEYNFKRREYCFQCGTSRLDSELGDDGCNEISQYPTRTVMLRNLDVLTVQETIVSKLKQLLVDKFVLIANIVLSKDPLTSTSRGICYLQMRNVFESVSIFNVLLVTPFSIDGKPVSVTYGTFDCGQISEPVENFINFGTVSDSCIYTASDLQYLAECSALKYAKTSAEFDHYFEYYKKFFADKISLGEMNNVNKQQAAAAAAIAAAEAASSTSKTSNVPDQKDIPTGSDNKKYSKPDINQFQYDESTGYHYDSKTGLYFDSSKNLYYNGFLQRYMYWDDGNNTYVHIPNHENDVKAKKGDRKSKGSSGADMGDKVKVAKKITKDLEKWAKSLNQKKEQFNKSLMSPVVSANESQSMGGGGSSSMRNLKNEFEVSPTSSAQLTDSIDNIEMGIDWNKLVCLICQRQFSSKELLNKHQLLSELHKTNLQNYLKRNESGEDWTRSGGEQTTMTTPKYRDRAKERRMKFGESEPAPESKYLSRLQQQETTPEPMSNNLGSKLLQKMGWSEGQGLGKKNQGRTSIVEADGRLNSAGLGSKFSISTSQGESYVESAKKVMYARYSNCKDSD